ncbi:MAG: relaxase/mobilization nuclease domain-containing protein [Steroidobacteraceae bacterium]
MFSGGRGGAAHSPRLSGGQIAQIQRTVGGASEVMVKVTGGGGSVGGVAAHFAYISHKGERDLETDDGQRVSKEGHKALLKDWHLELMVGQYRKPQGSKGRAVKLVHNIVLSMPAPTPADKVLAAAKSFAREKFALKHRYAMVLHTHQQHPHVHLVVKAEDEHGHRLHIDKALLREWRQDFAQMMRDQGIAANATARAVRGQSKCSARDARYQTQRGGSSHAQLERMKTVIEELSKTGTVRDPARSKLQETRQAVLSGWMGVADRLDAQGEIVLAGDVRYFARHLPPVLTDRERLAQQLISHARIGVPRERDRDLTREREGERTR